MATPISHRIHQNEFSLAEERVNIFKAAWTDNISDKFVSCHSYLLSQTLVPVICECSNSPRVESETVDLHTCNEILLLVLRPSLESNQGYLELIRHSAVHASSLVPPDFHTVTYADVAAAACNVKFLRLLFTSSEKTVREFYTQYYSYQDSAAIVKLFIHALNGGSCEVVDFLTEILGDELTAYWKLVIMEVCLWLATTDKKINECFKHLVHKFGVNLRDECNKFSPLRLTCFYCSSDMAEYLIENGADMYVVNSDGHAVSYDAYQYGAYTGQWDVVKMLLSKGLPVDAVMSKTDFVCYPLMYIFIQHNEMELVRCLVDHGHSVNMPICFTADRRSHSVTLLVLALTYRHQQLVSWLIDNDADCNARSFHSQQLDDDSWTPLHVAVTQNDLSMVMSLVKHGAQLGALTARGETVIELAYDQGKNIDVVNYLLQINVPVVSFPESTLKATVKGVCNSNNMWSLLDLAIYKGDWIFTQTLLSCGHYHHPPTISRFFGTHITLDLPSQQKALHYVYEAQKQVCTLQVLCRDVLRAACVNLLHYTQSVSMPGRLKSILLLEDILEPYICSRKKSNM